ncbi:uncharacterized protein LOC117567434 [Drosophila albomicans]|uniref:Uncharacterized protein LOC117567434 n=1 Tax=Drosophila albomicans TaxID=7291 RepID=A0A9C6W9X3_DROAB|nr:uncharacterized protein LOC117567434 [Drosophila albomicans]
MQDAELQMESKAKSKTKSQLAKSNIIIYRKCQRYANNNRQQQQKSKVGLRSNRSQQKRRRRRFALITAMGHFRPKNATPIQFYNYVREFCIMHNCSIDEAMERAPIAWKELSNDQRELYNSEKHAALPIPVPQHLLYRAIQMERAGRWKLSSVPAGKGGAPMYSMESYSPPTKPTRLQTLRRAQKPRYDNLAETSPCCLDAPLARHNNNNSGARKLRTLTPPEQRAQRAQQEKSQSAGCSLSVILSTPSLKPNENEEKRSDDNKSKSSKLDKITLPKSKCMRKQGKRKQKKRLSKQQALTETLAKKHKKNNKKL